MSDFDAQKMIEDAFGRDPWANHPLAFVREPRFKNLVNSISTLYVEDSSDIKTILSSMVEILSRVAQYSNDDPRVPGLAERATLIMRDLLREDRQGAELLMIVAAMLTNIAVFSAAQSDQ